MHFQNVLCLIAATALFGCMYQPRSSDAVRDAQTAISLAKKACLHGMPDGGRWEAKFSAGLWEVQESFENSKSGCGWGIKVNVWADTGANKPCEICVVAT
jgi:hypothetical protein